MKQNVRVRFPPSPTGIPHIGNTRTALFNYIFAKHHKGEFILRIEDTDQARLVPGAEEAIKEILDWLGLVPDEFYKQSERLDLYKKAVEELLKKGLARKDEGAVRFIVPKGKTVSWNDKVGNKDISFQSDDIEDFVILKSDGFPTYHLANVVDDHEMKISHVMRGDEWISSTPKHILLYEAFGWKPPIFAHLPVILGPDKTKISKRHGAESVLEYRDKGYLRDVLINFMLLLGWTHPDQKEIFSIDEAIKLFELKDINTNSPVFDMNKLTWLNGQYIRQLKIDELKSNIKNQILKITIDDDLLVKILPLAQERMKTLNDFNELVSPYFNGASKEITEKDKKLAEKLLETLENVDPWENENILAALKQFCANEKVNMRAVYKIVTGKEQGLPIVDMMAMLGKEQILDKVKRIV